MSVVSNPSVKGSNLQQGEEGDSVTRVCVDISRSSLIALVPLQLSNNVGSSPEGGYKIDRSRQ